LFIQTGGCAGLLDWKPMPELETLGGQVEDAIERVRVPAYVIDGHGIIRWLNPAARKLVGDVRGRQLTSVVAPEETRRAREIFARTLIGPPSGSDNKVAIMNANGERLSVEVSAVPLRSGGHVIGVFG
jgi:PAS domain S-box-containing protein